ncbi:hypothetical protein BgiMline_010518, partial [Biomphalaria glabrata]
FDRSILNICMDIKINCILLFFIAPFHTGFCDTEEDYACMERTQTCKIAMFFNINQDDGDNEVLCQDYDFFFKCLFNQGCKRNQTKNEQLIEKYGDIIVSLGCSYTVRDLLDRYDKTPTNKEIACAEGKLRCNEDYERSLELTPGNHKHICQKLEYAFKCTHNLGCEISESEIEHNIRTFSEVVNILHCPFTLREFVNRYSKHQTHASENEETLNDIETEKMDK